MRARSFFKAISEMFAEYTTPPSDFTVAPRFMWIYVQENEGNGYFLEMCTNGQEFKVLRVSTTITTIIRYNAFPQCDSCRRPENVPMKTMRLWGNTYSVCPIHCEPAFLDALQHNRGVRLLQGMARVCVARDINRVIESMSQYFPRELVKMCLQMLW